MYTPEVADHIAPIPRQNVRRELQGPVGIRRRGQTLSVMGQNPGFTRFGSKRLEFVDATGEGGRGASQKNHRRRLRLETEGESSADPFSRDQRLDRNKKQ